MYCLAFLQEVLIGDSKLATIILVYSNSYCNTCFEVGEFVKDGIRNSGITRITTNGHLYGLCNVRVIVLVVLRNEQTSYSDVT